MTDADVNGARSYSGGGAMSYQPVGSAADRSSGEAGIYRNGSGISLNAAGIHDF